MVLAANAVAADGDSVDVAVEVGGWEHECCGEAIERDSLVSFGCMRGTQGDGMETLIETHHDRVPDVRVSGRVTDLHVVRADGATEPVLRVPSGRALRGADPMDDGHLQTPWTAEPVPAGSSFLVCVHA
jgi:hypothetical protein